MRKDGLPVSRDKGVLVIDVDMLERPLCEEPWREIIGAKADDEGAQPALVEDARGDAREHAGQDELRELTTAANPRRIVGIDVTGQDQALEIAAGAKRAIADSLDLG